MEVFLNDTLPSFLQESHTSHRLAHTLLEALFTDLEDNFPKFGNRHGAHDPKFRRLHQLQAWVGWSQLFQGRLVHKWSQLQEAFLVSLPIHEQLDRKYYTGTIWTRKLISLLWDTMRAQWDLRNADRHGRTKEESHAIKHTRLLMEQVAVQYVRGPSMLSADRDIMAGPIFQKAKHSPAALELWLARNVPIVKLSTTAATAAITKTHKKITSFFRRKRPPGLPGWGTNPKRARSVLHGGAWTNLHNVIQTPILVLRLDERSC